MRLRAHPRSSNAHLWRIRMSMDHEHPNWLHIPSDDTWVVWCCFWWHLVSESVLTGLFTLWVLVYTGGASGSDSLHGRTISTAIGSSPSSVTPLPPTSDVPSSRPPVLVVSGSRQWDLRGTPSSHTGTEHQEVNTPRRDTLIKGAQRP